MWQILTHMYLWCKSATSAAAAQTEPILHIYDNDECNVGDLGIVEAILYRKVVDEALSGFAWHANSSAYGLQAVHCNWERLECFSRGCMSPTVSDKTMVGTRSEVLHKLTPVLPRRLWGNNTSHSCGGRAFQETDFA